MNNKATYHILFVDDDPHMQKMVELFMRNSPHRLTCARNGRSALKMLVNNSFDLIITDIQMPELDGLSLIEEIRKTDLEIPIVIISAFGQDKMSQRAIQKGAAKILNKPFDSNQLLNVIDQFTVGQK